LSLHASVSTQKAIILNNSPNFIMGLSSENGDLHACGVSRVHWLSFPLGKHCCLSSEDAELKAWPCVAHFLILLPFGASLFR
jgi:hypothetical protein